jgi:hypothetical protein
VAAIADLLFFVFAQSTRRQLIGSRKTGDHIKERAAGCLPAALIVQGWKALIIQPE